MRRSPIPWTVLACVRLKPMTLLTSVTFTRFAAAAVLAVFFAMYSVLSSRRYAPTISASSLPRIRATRAGSFNPIRPANVARTTLCGFAEPSDLVSTFWMPHDSTTARTAPPAIRPVPSGAGLSSTLPEPNLPTTWCGIVAPLPSGTRIRFFFAASMPFLIADGTSFALPMPKPTTPWPSPTTTSALKLRFLPPLTTLVTRLIDTTVSLISSCDASTFSRSRFINAITGLPSRNTLRAAPLSRPGPPPSAARWCRTQVARPSPLELQTCFARRVGHCLHAPVIEEPVAVEHHALDALLQQPLGDRLANRLGALDVAAGRLLRQPALHRRLDGRGRGDGPAGHVVDDLDVHVRDAAEHRQPRPLFAAAHALANPELDPVASVFSGLDAHGYFAPVFPTFFFSTSPA